MALNETDFIDRDYQAARLGASTAPPPAQAGAVAPRRAPTREDLDAQLTSTQQQLARLREAQEQLERARAEVEEVRRRQSEFHTGREELRQLLVRGTGLLEQAEFKARREAEQLTQSLGGLREALRNVEAINETQWTDADWNQELGRALATLENSRMEYNSARLKWPMLDDTSPDKSVGQPGQPGGSFLDAATGIPAGRLFQIGLALTWPLAAAVLLAFGTLVVLLLRR